MLREFSPVANAEQADQNSGDCTMDRSESATLDLVIPVPRYVLLSTGFGHEDR